MKVTLEIPPEIAAQAEARGLRVDAYVQQLLTQQAGTRSTGNGRPRTHAEIRAWLDSLAQFSDKIPPPPEIISREWIYQEHD